MAPKTKPAKKSPKPSKASKAKARLPAPAAAEPETITAPADASAARAPAATAAVGKQDPNLNELADHLAEQSEPMVPVAQAVTKAYGGLWTPDRELSVLRLIKADARFALAPGKAPGVTLVGLVANASAEASTAASEPAAEPAAKTLGEHVAAAKGSPNRISWPVELGSSVLLLTDGHPPKKAIIRNIANHGGFTLYDLNLGGAGGTVDGVPASRIGRDLDAEGEVERWRMRCRALERFCDKGASLAQKIVERGAVARQLAEALLKEKHAIAELEQQLAEHSRAEPGQTDLRDVVGDGAAAAAPAPSRGAKMKAPPAAAEDKLAAKKPAAEAHADDAVELAAVGLTVEEIEDARFEQGTASTGKPQQVKPVKIKGQAWVAVDAQRGCAVLLRVHDKAEWKAAGYGKPLALPSDTQPKQLAEGGRWCGVPVKVGRATCWLGATRFALLVRLPPKQLAAEPETKATGKEAAAGGD
jgi:hypothetical protein